MAQVRNTTKSIHVHSEIDRFTFNNRFNADQHQCRRKKIDYNQRKLCNGKLFFQKLKQ